MFTIVIPLRPFEQALSTLLRQPHTIAVCRAGCNRTPEGTELLCRDVAVASPAAPLRADGDRALFALARTEAELHDSHRAWQQALSSVRTRALTAFLLVGVDAARGHLAGFVITEHDTLAPLRALKLIGAGMHHIQIPNPNDQIPNLNHQLTNSPTHRAGTEAPPLPLTIWSRTIGALGGEEIWHRLASLHPGIIGCGRTGSLVATTLARLGVRDLTLIDPDVVEEHNLGEMDAVTAADLGKPKVEAVAENVSMGVWEYGSMGVTNPKSLPPYPHTPIPPHSITALPRRVTERQALAAVKRCDVLFCCVDNDAARLATTVLATLYLKPLIDIGTGVFLTPMTSDQIPNPNSTTPQPTSQPTPQPTPQPTSQPANQPLTTHHSPLTRRLMGGDIRLLIPGEACLLCRGGLVHEEEARKNLTARNLSLTTDADYGRWNQQRAGSLRTLNQIAAHLGVQMLQDLVAERIRESLWARVEFDDAGRMTVNYPPTHQPANPPCPLCAKMGLGDEAFYFANSDERR